MPTKRDYGSSQNGSNASRPSAGTPSISTGVKTWPTPTKTDAWDSARHTTTTGIMHPGTMSLDAVRDFYSSEPTGHPAPIPTIRDGTNGSSEPPVVNPEFVARLMGLPQDWLSSVPIPDEVVEAAYEKLRKEKKPDPEDDEDDATPSPSIDVSSSSPVSETVSSRRLPRRRS